MYRIEYLPSALRDVVEIGGYISRELANPIAAEHLVNEIISAIDELSVYPYAWPLYVPLFAAKRPPLAHEYRKLPVKNYLIFYYVDEQAGLITISNVIYGKRDLSLPVEPFPSP